MKPAWSASLEARLIGRLAAIHILALMVGLLALLNKRHRFIHGLSDVSAVWGFPIFALMVLVVVILTVRASLRPVHAASRQAAAIVPGAPGVRLDGTGAPAEILPFVKAVNEALQRLDQAFQAQRRFTADAAHELRTPLTILTAGIAALPPNAEVMKLRDDSARMGRLVEQLLRVARLDALPLATMTPIDLCLLAADVVAQMAPWAHGLGRSLGLEIPTAPVIIVGEAEALGGALRNLIENAVHYAPAGSEALVEVTSTAALRVVDKGPGISPEYREQVFGRFWRAPGTARPGAGLGLAIVVAVAEAHQAEVRIEDTPGGGATIVLAFHPLKG